MKGSYLYFLATNLYFQFLFPPSCPAVLHCLLDLGFGGCLAGVVRLFSENSPEALLDIFFLGVFLLPSRGGDPSGVGDLLRVDFFFLCEGDLLRFSDLAFLWEGDRLRPFLRCWDCDPLPLLWELPSILAPLRCLAFFLPGEGGGIACTSGVCSGAELAVNSIDGGAKALGSGVSSGAGVEVDEAAGGAGEGALPFCLLLLLALLF